LIGHKNCTVLGVFAKKARRKQKKTANCLVVSKKSSNFADELDNGDDYDEEQPQHNKKV